MKNYLVVLLVSLGLTACNDNHDEVRNNATQTLAPNLAQGTYAVSIETDQEYPMAGKYYSGADGNKLLTINNDEDRAEVVMSYDSKAQKWQTNQDDKNKSIRFAHTDKISDDKIDIGSLSGNYNLSLANGNTLTLQVDNQGQIQGQGENCSFTGLISANQIANTANYQIQKNTCDVLKNNLNGFLVVDEDLSPTNFRLVSSMTGSQDIWAFISS